MPMKSKLIKFPEVMIEEISAYAARIALETPNFSDAVRRLVHAGLECNDCTMCKNRCAAGLDTCDDCLEESNK